MFPPSVRPGRESGGNGSADRLGGGLQRINRTSEIERTRSEAEFSHAQCGRPHRRKSPFMKSTNLRRKPESGRQREEKQKRRGRRQRRQTIIRIPMRTKCDALPASGGATEEGPRPRGAEAKKASAEKMNRETEYSSDANDNGKGEQLKRETARGAGEKQGRTK